jgi:hypothetical protein
MFIECRHIMPTGRKCRAAALRGKPFCFFHAKLHFRKTVTRRPGKLTEPRIEDVSAITAAVAKALSALCSPLTDTRHAGLLLYGLHLAASLSKRVPLPELEENQAKESGKYGSDSALNA